MVEHETLLEMVDKHANLSDDEYSDISKHGASSGWPNFTYTKDCCDFFDNNEKDLLEFMSDRAEEIGFNNMFEYFVECHRGEYASLDNFKNWVAWYVLETVAHNKQMD